MLVERCASGAEEQDAWDDYVNRSAAAGHCHLSGWRRVVRRSYGHAACYLWIRDAGEVRGVLPLILVRGWLFGRSIVSLPFLDDGGMCASDGPAQAALCDAAIGLLRESGANLLDLRQRYPIRLPLSNHGAKVTMALDLAMTPDRMWQRLDVKVRNQIRKAMKRGLTVSWAGRERLDEFYRVFATNMRDLGSPVHSTAFFGAILDEFPDSARLILVESGGETIGAGLCLLFRDQLAMPWASSLRQHASSCPNNLLYWEVIRWGCEKGFRRFDFGRSSPGSGTYRFKKQWGTVEEPLHWRYLGRVKGARATLDATDVRYRWMAHVWKRLPVTIVNRIGPMVRGLITN